MLGAALSRGSGLISSILVARMLGKSGFGELGIIQSTIGMFGTFAGFGLGMTATKFIAEYRTTNPAKAGRIRGISSAFAWVTSALTSLVLFVAAPWLAEHALAAPHVGNLLKVGSLLLFFGGVSGAQLGALSGFEAFKSIAKISFWTGITTLPLTVAGAYIGGVEGAVWGLVIAGGVSWLLSHFAIETECRKAEIPHTYKGCWAERRVLWKFALPAVISSAFFAPTDWALNALLVNQPEGYGQMGVLNAARQWQMFILYLPSVISNMTLPMLSNLLGEGNRRSYVKLVVLNSVALVCLALLAALPVAVFSGTIMSAYGNGFGAGQNALLLVCAASVLWALHIVIGQVMWSTGASAEAMFFAAFRSIILLVAGVILVKQGAAGLCLALLVTYILQTLYLVPYVKYKVNRLFNDAGLASIHPGKTE